MENIDFDSVVWIVFNWNNPACSIYVVSISLEINMWHIGGNYIDIVQYVKNVCIVNSCKGVVWS